MPKNLGNVLDPKDLTTKEYVDNKFSQLCTRGNVQILSSSSIVTIPFTPTDTSKLLVYHNGLLLSETIHYTVSGSTITLIGYTAEVNDVFQFITI